MEFKYSAAPHLRQKLSTSGIMMHLTIGLLVVYAFGLYNAYRLGMDYLVNALILMATSIITALITEGLWALAHKENVIKYISHSFGWVTAIILTLMGNQVL